MANVLHVLNGDATLNGFRQTGIKGDVMVWREVLSEGPLLTNVVDAEFWNRRSAWVSSAFKDSTQQYSGKVIDELAMLDKTYKEINLWFEFDLHCQINLLGVINYIEERGDLSTPALYLICPDHYRGVNPFFGMGQLNGSQLRNLFDNIRVQLNEVDLHIAGCVWKLYSDGDVGGIRKFLEETDYWANMKHLKPALEAHLKRVQVNDIGLNYIEQKLLDIYHAGSHTRREIYKRFWETEKIYGMGDMELDVYLGHLTNKKLIENL